MRERLRARGFTYPEIRVDYIGMSSLHGMGVMGKNRPEPYEVRLRIAAASCFFGEPMYYHADKGDAKPASFWAASPTNFWRHNVAAGSTNDGSVGDRNVVRSCSV